MLTRADIYKRKMVNAVHIDFSRRESAWMGTVEGVPRLSVYQHRGDKLTHTWSVDAKPLKSLDAALDVLNGVKTLEQAIEEAAEQEIPAQAHRPGKISVEAQIAEIDYELAQRKSVYARMKGKDARQDRENELHVDRMKAVRATLVWLRDNESLIKQRVSY